MLTKKERHAPSLEHQRRLKEHYARIAQRKAKQAHAQGTPRNMFKPLGEVVDMLEMKNKKDNKNGFIKNAFSNVRNMFSKVGHRRKV